MNQINNVLNKENYRVAIENSPVPMILSAEDGEILLISKSCLEIVGYDFEEVNTIDKWTTAVHPGRKAYNDEFIKRNFEEGVKIQGEEEAVYTKSGEKRIWKFHNQLMGRLEDGRIGMITVILDVTEKNLYRDNLENTLNELEKSQFLLRASLESHRNLSIYSLDLEYRYLYFNSLHKELMLKDFGTKCEIGKSITECVTTLEDQIQIKQAVDHIANKISESYITNFSHSNCIYESSYSPIYNKQNEVIAISIVTKDITERVHELQEIKESEEKFRLIYSSMSQGLAVHEVITDDNGNPINYKYVEVNDSYLKLFGYEKEDVIGKTIKEIAPQIEDYWIQNFGKVALTGTPSYFENYSISIDKCLSTYAYSPKKGQFAVLISDITERIEREKEIKFLSYNDQLTGVHNRRYYDKMFVELDKPENLPLSMIIGDVNGLKLVNDSFGHMVGDQLLITVANILTETCRGTDIVTRIGGDEFVIFLPNTDERDAETVVRRLQLQAQKTKVNNINLSISFGYGTKSDIYYSMIDLFKKIEDDMYSRKLHEGQSMRSKTVDLIMQTLYEKNEREMNHSRRVGLYCEKLATVLKMDTDQIQSLKTAGLMHDIGKIGVPEKILNKTGELTDDELHEIHKHSETGYRILNSIQEFTDISNQVLEHHEFYDGTGYPKGLKGEEISLQGRILSICDAYDAMTGPRPYKSPISREEALEELRRCKGTQFDPYLVDVFIDKVIKKAY